MAAGFWSVLTSNVIIPTSTLTQNGEPDHNLEENQRLIDLFQ
jgi:hypothetical protein